MRIYQHLTEVYYIIFTENTTVDVERPLADIATSCSSNLPGDVDFQTVDLIAVYKMDQPDTKGITLVQGSQNLQKAYRIGLDVNLTLPLQ